MTDLYFEKKKAYIDRRSDSRPDYVSTLSAKEFLLLCNCFYVYKCTTPWKERKLPLVVRSRGDLCLVSMDRTSEILRRRGIIVAFRFERLSSGERHRYSRVPTKYAKADVGTCTDGSSERRREALFHSHEKWKFVSTSK